MRTTYKILNICLFLLIVFSFLQCSRKPVSDCNSRKIEMLLEDVFRKEAFFPVYSNDYTLIKKAITVNVPIDSSMYFNYLYSPNLKVPDKVFYLHWSKSLAPSFPDSIKLRVINDSVLKESYAFKVGVVLLEVNEDTTKLKLNVSYGTPNNIAIDEGELTYSFDEKNCKWIVLDSTIRQY